MNAAEQTEPEAETSEATKKQWDRELRDMLAVAANVDIAERYRSPHRFGELTGAELTSITDELDRGILDRYADLIEFFLETDTKFASLHAGRVARIVHRPWRVKPAKDGDPHLAQLTAEFCDEYLRRIHKLHEAFKQIASAVTPGFSANEMIWKIDPKRNAYMVERIEHRHGHRFRYGPTWTLRLYDRGRKAGRDGMGTPLDPRRWIVHFHIDQPGYPSVYGLGRSCLWTLLFKRYAQRFRISGVERFGNPYIWMEILGNADKKVREEALRKLQRISSTQVGIVEAGNTIHFEMPGSMHAGGQPQKAFIDDANADLTERYAGTSDATTPGEHGSQAAVAVRTETQTDPLDNDGVIAFGSTLHDTLIKQMCLMNWHVFGVQDPSELPIPEIDGSEEKKAPAVPRVPEVGRDDQQIDASAPAPSDASPTPADDGSAEPKQFMRTDDPKASASGEPRRARAKSRSRTTSCSHAIQCAGVQLEP